MLLTPVPIFVQYHRSQNKYENQFQSQDQSCHFGVGNTMLTPKKQGKKLQPSEVKVNEDNRANLGTHLHWSAVKKKNPEEKQNIV